MIDFTNLVSHPENNRQSEEILVKQSARLSNNAKTLLDALNRGERLTGKGIISKYGFLEYRRRIKDLRDAGVKVQERVLDNGCKEWYL